MMIIGCTPWSSYTSSMKRIRLWLFLPSPRLVLLVVLHDHRPWASGVSVPRRTPSHGSQVLGPKVQVEVINIGRTGTRSSNWTGRRLRSGYLPFLAVIVTVTDPSLGSRGRVSDVPTVWGPGGRVVLWPHSTGHSPVRRREVPVWEFYNSVDELRKRKGVGKPFSTTEMPRVVGNSDGIPPSHKRPRTFLIVTKVSYRLTDYLWRLFRLWVHLPRL